MDAQRAGGAGVARGRGPSVATVLTVLVTITIYELLRWVARGIARAVDEAWLGVKLSIRAWLYPESLAFGGVNVAQIRLGDVHHTVSQAGMDGVVWAGNWFQSIEFWVWAQAIGVIVAYVCAAVVTIVIIMTSLWSISRRLGGWVKPVAWSMRGVQYESMRQGSRFVPGSVPKFQITILEPGILRDKHIGYGLRVHSDYMVVPLHVIAASDQVVLEGHSGKKIVIQPSITKSKVMPDLAYVYVGTNNFSRIQASTATLVEAAGHVACTGREGTSTGLLRQLPVKGAMAYEGSTLPGMSGAAYVLDDSTRVAGMHHGVMGAATNYGTASVVIMLELSLILQPALLSAVTGGIKHEASEDFARFAAPESEDEEDDRPKKGGRAGRKRAGLWDREDMQEELTNAWRGAPGEPIPVGMDWYTATWGESTRPVLAPKKKSKKSPVTISIPNVTPIAIGQQNNDGQEVMFKVARGSEGDEEEDLKEYINGHVNAIYKRLEAVEAALVKVSEPKGSFPCPSEDCDTVCTTEKALANHRASAHPKWYTCTYPGCSAKSKSAEAQANHVKESHEEERKKASFPCDQCDVVCRSEMRLANHVANTHVVGESAFTGIDTGSGSRKVRQGPFLGHKSSSSRRTSPSSRRNSTSSGAKNRSPSLEEILSRMAGSLSSLERALSVQQQPTAGPSSGAPRK